MKINDAQASKCSRGVLVALLALAASVGIAGCGGSGAKDVQDPGSSGGSGPPGPVGPPAPEVPINEGGDVNFSNPSVPGMNGTGAGLTAQQVTDIRALLVTIDSASVATTCSSSGACATHPVVEFTVTTAHGGAVLGLAASTLRFGVAKLVPVTGGYPSRWQSYINRTQNGTITTPPAALPSAVQANVETGAVTGWAELGDGRYRYVATVNLAAVTTPIAVTYEPSLTHRYSMALNLASNAAVLDPDNPFKDFVPNGGPVTTERLISATASCASCHVRFAEHGGSRRSVEYCVVCHNPATTDPDSGQSVNLAYMAHSIHYGAHRSQPYVVYGFNNEIYTSADVTYPQPVTFCEKCHELTDATPQGNAWRTTTEAAACGGCHSAGLNVVSYSMTTGLYTYTYTHSTDRLPPDVNTFPNGTCVGCHSAGGAAGSTYQLHAKDPARKAILNGEKFEYQILSVENVAPPPPAPVAFQPKVTFQILQNGSPMDVKAITDGQLRLDFGWSTKDIFNITNIVGSPYAADRGKAIVVDLLSSENKPLIQGNGPYSYTLPQPLPWDSDSEIRGTGLMVVLEGRRVVQDNSGASDAYPDSAYAFAGGDAREKIVDQAKCEACHKQVSAHDGDVAGDPMVCTICHSGSLGGTFGTDSFGPLALGAFIHGVHSSNVAPIGDVTYPHSLARCESCHVADSFNVARTAALPMTMNAGTDAMAWQDDLANSATAGTCNGCHDSAAAQTHMESQGGTFGVPKTLVPSSSQEGCAFCHDVGSTYDTRVEHCNNLPLGQCVVP